MSSCTDPPLALHLQVHSLRSPAAVLLQDLAIALPAGADAITFYAMLRNLVPVILGNIFGGSVLVALVYYVIYIRPKKIG